jgi:thiamine-phosphate pyrophosphorylase
MDPSVFRILDANLNRAREALRVLEEYARLALDDEALSRRIKALRHELGAAARAIGGPRLLSERRIDSDVGTRISLRTEQSRASTTDVAAVAAKRAAESLRSLEEYAKIAGSATGDGTGPTAFERMRYEVYSVEQALFIGAPRQKRLRDARLHVLLSESSCGGPWRDVCRAALQGGADVIQLREKELPDAELLDRAGELREMTSEFGALLMVNDRPDIARLCDADGVHLGQEDLRVADARCILGPARLVGVSTHRVEEARRAAAEGADDIGVGPMFASATKPNVHVAGPTLLVEVAGVCAVPLVAIGGIDASNVERLAAPRPFAVAVSRAVIAADNPAAAARAIRSAVPCSDAATSAAS